VTSAHFRPLTASGPPALRHRYLTLALQALALRDAPELPGPAPDVRPNSNSRGTIRRKSRWNAVRSNDGMALMAAEDDPKLVSHCYRP
jgi:hypothetical protein